MCPGEVWRRSGEQEGEVHGQDENMAVTDDARRALWYGAALYTTCVNRITEANKEGNLIYTHPSKATIIDRTRNICNGLFAWAAEMNELTSVVGLD